MPRYFVGQASGNGHHVAIDRDELVERLVAEFDVAQSPQPVITEERLTPEAYYVRVIWDAFEDLPVEQRTEIVLDAYRRVEPEKIDKIVNAVGFTADEAYAAGLLPYTITPVRRRDRQADAGAVSEAMEQEREQTVLGNHGVELRYPTLEAAEQSRQRLEQATADVLWVITQEVGSVAEYYER